MKTSSTGVAGGSHVVATEDFFDKDTAKTENEDLAR